MLASKFYKVEDDLVEKEGFVLQRLERALGREYSEVRHSLLSRGLLRTLADEVLIERHLRQMGNLHGDPLAKARARFSLAVVQLSEFLDEMGIECPDDIELLVVEDDANDEAATCRAIGNMEVPPDVKVARDGSEALQLLQKGDFLPSMVLLDLKLPKLGGFEVLSEMRRDALLKDVAVVVFSSSDLEEDVDKCKALGVHGYVRKPICSKEYADAVKTAVQIGTASYRVTQQGRPKRNSLQNQAGSLAVSGA